MMPVLVSGSASPMLSSELSRTLGWELVKPEVRKFPDGEIYLRITSSLEGEEVVVIESLSPPQNEHLTELLFLLDLCRDLGARKLTALVPYLAYARQDKRFKDGEALSVKTIARLLELADKVVVVEAHSKESLSYFKKVEEVKCFSLLGNYLAKLGLRDPLFLSPDEGSMERVREAAKAAGADFDCLQKERLSGTRVRIERKRVDASGRDVVILDDIISTGGTVVESCKLLKGARRIWACCVHGLFVGNALERMKSAGVSRILSTDTIESRYSKISVAPALIKHL